MADMSMNGHSSDPVRERAHPHKHRRRRPLAIGAGLVAGSAVVAALAVASGRFMPVEEVSNDVAVYRPGVRAVGLLTLIGGPFGALARHAWSGDGRTELTSLLAAELAVAWVVLELTLVRSASVLDGVFIAAGTGALVGGRRAITDIVRSYRSQRRRSG